MSKDVVNQLHKHYQSALKIDGMLLREEAQIEIKNRLDQHEKWLQTGGREGIPFRSDKEDLTGVDFSYRDLSGAEFINCILRYCDFSYVKFGETTLGSKFTRLFDCTVDKSLFINAELTKCTILDSVITSCNFKFAKIKLVSMSGTLQLHETTKFDGSVNDFSFCEISESNITALNFTSSLFEKCKLHLTKFTRCNLDNIDFSKSTPSSSMLFSMCRMSSTDFSGLLIEGSQFTSCVLMYSKFIRTLGKQSNFSGSVLDLANFSNADVSNCKWSGATAQMANFFGAYMQDGEALGCWLRFANFSNCDLHGIDLAGSDLMGAIMNENTNRNLVNFSGCTWINGKRCKAGSLGVCYEEQLN